MNAHVETINLFFAPLNLRVAKRLLHTFRNLARFHYINIRYWNFLELHHRDQMRHLFSLILREFVIMDELDWQSVLALMVCDLNQKCLEQVSPAGRDVRRNCRAKLLYEVHNWLAFWIVLHRIRQIF